ncbi:hypothetical protein BGZ65_012845, partial [Modicella reniformis]
MMKHTVPKPTALADPTTPSANTPHVPLQRAPALDMTSVATTAPPENRRTDPPTRIFSLPDAPCFYPTKHEFLEPLKYIESIRPLAEKAGICKIIPPAGWKPPFALDTE